MLHASLTTTVGEDISSTAQAQQFVSLAYNNNLHNSKTQRNRKIFSNHFQMRDDRGERQTFFWNEIVGCGFQLIGF